ncbi:hypothetical protein QWA68_013067 [Fusarium oxysporum]|nr:hypothetical protein QWA68_013067 [Fusarium oxysporum]
MHLSANLRAAQAIISARQRLLRGRIRDAAHLPDDRGGRPRLLTDDEEEAIVAFVVWMQKSGLPASKYEVEDTANTLRRRRDPDAKVGILRERVECLVYFGCNEHLQQPRNAFREYDLPPNTETIQKEGPVWRLLVIDGFFAFREYCMKFNTLIAFLLPHLTHILQPMDLREALRKGKLTFNRRDFAGAFQDIFNEGFTRAHIISGFENSPTRQGLMHIQKIINEAILLEKHVLENVNDRRTRIEKSTISLQELREQQDEYVAESQKKSIRSEIRQQRSQLIRELEALKQEWGDNREVTVEGITKKLQFKKWLEVTGKNNDYLSMDTQRSAMTEALNEVAEATVTGEEEQNASRFSREIVPQIGPGWMPPQSYPPFSYSQ